MTSDYSTPQQLIADLQRENALLTARLVAADGLLGEIKAHYVATGHLFDLLVRVEAYLASEKPEGALIEDLRVAYQTAVLIAEDDNVLACSDLPNCQATAGMGHAQDCAVTMAHEICALLKRWLPEGSS